ncbi:linalool dehydratase/isomerase domain-containing protein [Saccharopolyspora sp. NPDC002578]
MSAPIPAGEPAATRDGDRAVTVLLPDVPAFGPVTARRMRRALAAYAVVWLAGSLPGWLGAGPAAVAFGHGLALPGGGFLLDGSFAAAALTAVAFVLSLALWWYAGPVVLPPLVWVAGAAVAALTVSSREVAGAAAYLVPALPVAALALSLAAHLVRHRGRHRRRSVLNAELARTSFVVSGPPDLESGPPVRESSPEDLAHLRYALDVALQPLDRFDGFIVLEQYREGALRYQLTSLGTGLAMSQYTRTPAFSGYLAEAQRNAIEKMLDRRVWGYWRTENLWGNLSTTRDPLATDENIMLTGWHGTMLGLYALLNDLRYAEPGALTYRWSADEAYPYDHHAVARQIHDGMRRSDYALIPCEPNWVYTVCNAFGINAMLGHDRAHGTDHVEDLRERLRHSYEHEFLRPDGRIVGVRARHLGLSWNFWSGTAVQLNTVYWMHAAFPDLAQRAWWLLRRNELTLRDGVPALPPRASNRVDVGSYRLGRDTFAQVAITMAAREIGDGEMADAAAALLAEREPVEERNGSRRFADASPMVNFYGVLGRFGRQHALRDLLGHGGVPQAWRTGPRLAEAAYPDVLVARAVTDGRALDLVLRPGAGPVRTVLAVDRLVPGSAYRVAGACADEVTADARGRAVVEVDLDGRRELRLYPS